MTHPSAVMPHTVQATPLPPQPVTRVWLPTLMHVAPLQQPLLLPVQLLAQAAHAPLPLTQVSPFIWQLVQVAPLRPHCASVWFWTQLSRSLVQQPGHPVIGVASHKQVGLPLLASQ